MKTKIFLVLIILVAFFLRLYRLSELPPGFHIDEVTVGWNAYSLMETGRDENGNFLPLYIDSFGDFRPAGYFYLTVPSIKLFGLNEFATRFPSALFGVLTVLMVFFLTEHIFQNRSIAYLSSFLLAISPWHLIISRATSESSMALFLILLGTYLFLQGIKKEKLSYFLIALFLFVFSFYTYHTPRVFVPLLVLGMVLLGWQTIRKKRQKRLVLSFLVACLIIVALVVLAGQGAGRFKQVSIFDYPGVQLRLDEQIREELPGINLFLVRAFHNKLLNYGLEILSNYGRHFDFDFLFIKGGLPIRYLVPETGLLYLVELPFLLLGILFIVRNKKIFAWLPLYWLLIGPLAVSLTQEDIPNVQRAFFMLPAFQILTAYGFYKSYQFVKKKKLMTLVLIGGSLVVLIYNFSYFSHQYLVHQRVYRPWYRNYGFRELIQTLNEIGPDYDKIILTKSHNDPYIYILFYNHYDPRLYHQYVHQRTKDEWGFENYVFYPRDCPTEVKKEVFREEKILFVDKGECESKPYDQVIKTIRREDQTPVFKLIEIDKEAALDYFQKQEKLKLNNEAIEESD